MITLVLGALRGLWKYLAVAVIAVGGVLTFGAIKKREGRKLERAKHIDRILENAQKAKLARRRVIDNLDHADKLRKRFPRK